MRILLLSASLVANLALAAILAFHPELVSAIFPSVILTRQPQSVKDVSVPSTPHRVLWSTLATHDLRILNARLRAAGFRKYIVEAIIRHEVRARYDSQISAMWAPDPSTPFWKPAARHFDEDQLIRIMQLQRERSALLRDLMGDGLSTLAPITAAQRQTFSALSPAQINVVRQIEDDYAQMAAAVRAGANDIILQEDRDKLALLAQERATDLAAVLSPAELADYEMKSSPSTQFLRKALIEFAPSESEFLAISKAQTLFNEQFPNIDMATPLDLQRQAQQVNQRNLRDALGDTRYADYVREMSDDYQQLYRIGKNNGIPTSSTIEAFNLRDSVAQLSNQIFDDPSLSVDGKRAALQELAGNTRRQLIGLLGPTAATAYLRTADLWLRNVEQGCAISFPESAPLLTVSSGHVTVLNSQPQLRRLPIADPSNDPQ